VIILVVVILILILTLIQSRPETFSVSAVAAASTLIGDSKGKEMAGTRVVGAEKPRRDSQKWIVASIHNSKDPCNTLERSQTTTRAARRQSWRDGSHQFTMLSIRF
jgi:uncharacterized Ntn-hydrolase superfamily protein